MRKFDDELKNWANRLAAIAVIVRAITEVWRYLGL
jgi:hypothetical protein